MVQLACMDMDSVLGVLEIVGRLMSENVRSGDAIRVRRMGAWAWGLLGRCREVGQLGSEEVGEIRELGKRAAKILTRMKRAKQAGVAREETEPPTGNEESDVDEEKPEVRESEPENLAAEELAETADASSHHDSMDISQQDVEPTEADTEELEVARARLQARLQHDRTLNSDTQLQQSNAADTAMEDVGTASKVSEEILPTDAEKQTRAMLDMIITIVGEFYGQRDLLNQRDIWEEDMM